MLAGKRNFNHPCFFCGVHLAALLASVHSHTAYPYGLCILEWPRHARREGRRQVIRRRAPGRRSGALWQMRRWLPCVMPGAPYRRPCIASCCLVGGTEYSKHEGGGQVSLLSFARPYRARTIGVGGIKIPGRGLWRLLDQERRRTRHIQVLRRSCRRDAPRDTAHAGCGPGARAMPAPGGDRSVRRGRPRPQGVMPAVQGGRAPAPEGAECDRRVRPHVAPLGTVRIVHGPA